MALPGRDAPQDVSISEEDAIRRTIAEAEAHQNDVEPFLALHTQAAAIVNIAGRRVLGKPAIKEAMSKALAGSLAQVLTKTEIEDIRFLRPDVALVSCIKHVSDQREPDATGAEAPALPSKGALTYVVTKEADTWRIASAQTTPVNVS
jgi:uncharacterized protein (TIGR02246 family)